MTIASVVVIGVAGSVSTGREVRPGLQAEGCGGRMKEIPGFDMNEYILPKCLEFGTLGKDRHTIPICGTY